MSSTPAMCLQDGHDIEGGEFPRGRPATVPFASPLL